MSRGVRPAEYSAIAAVTAVALALMLSLARSADALSRRGARRSGPTTDAEQYTYSAVWLAFGVTLLVVGMLLRSQAVRLASAAVVILTVLKVFLIDMSDLTGIYQSLSFIGLGIVLLGDRLALSAIAVSTPRAAGPIAGCERSTQAVA